MCAAAVSTIITISRCCCVYGQRANITHFVGRMDLASEDSDIEQLSLPSGTSSGAESDTKSVAMRRTSAWRCRRRVRCDAVWCCLCCGVTSLVSTPLCTAGEFAELQAKHAASNTGAGADDHLGASRDAYTVRWSTTPLRSLIARRHMPTVAPTCVQAVGDGP